MMKTLPQNQLAEKIRAPIAILGVPFDNVTVPEAIQTIEQMVASGQPHYLVTANVDFLVQARADIELRRILFDAHLVLCDGTPLVWASRLLGNALPERVAGADLVPLLIRVAAEKGYRLFFLGAAPDSIDAAVKKLNRQYPSLEIAGFYSPPFNKLLEMDHDEIVRRVKEARPDMLFVSFGCPKQEKWISMHYRSLGIPVTAGVGATIDFLAGRVKRAPVWMQRTGTEWIYRLVQEPRRLLRRYLKDLWVFGWSFVPQCWHLQAWRRHRLGQTAAERREHPTIEGENGESCLVAGLQGEAVIRVRLPSRLDHAAVCENPRFVEKVFAEDRDCLLLAENVCFVDSTGVGQLMLLQKKLRALGKFMVLVAPSRSLKRALGLMQVQEFFNTAPDVIAATRLLESRRAEAVFPPLDTPFAGGPFSWQGEITAANAAQVWNQTFGHLSALSGSSNWIIDLSNVRFIDSSGLGLMVRARKLARQNGRPLSFTGLQPPVRNVLRIAQLEDFLLCDAA